MNCTVHTDKESAGFCTYCGQPFCQDCLVNLDGRLLCKSCADRVYQEQRNAAAAAQQAPPVINVMNNNVNSNYNGGMYNHKSKLLAALLCFFLGVFGVHRFYVGKIGTGLIWLFTLGFFGIGEIIDLILIIVGAFKDKNGMPLN